MIGDIVVAGDEAKVVVDPALSDYIVANLEKVGGSRVDVQPVALAMLSACGALTKDIRGTVASMRLDAVASLGFGLSRSRAAALIKAQQVKVNWRPETDPACNLHPGDMITLGGRGRFKVASCDGESRKGRVRLTLTRYI